MGNKTLAALSLWLFGFSAVYSQEIPIQLMLVDNAGFEKVNHNVKLRLTMSNDTSSTLGQYGEVHLTQSNEFGIISENIGSGVATTNSQVLSLEQFTFLTNEPIIKVELDTSSVSNQYYTVGFLPYSYPMVARRALSADSSNYSDQSINSEYADTAEFARNFNESFDGDTSSSNELQVLLYSQDTLSISNRNKVYLPSGKEDEFNLKCVEMGVGGLCSTLGLDSTVCELSPTDNYTYDISLNNAVNSSGQSTKINWRKFEVEGLKLDSSKHLLLRYSEYRETNSYYETYHRRFNQIITPVIENERVYFYLHR